jgi:hypothetical protein
MARTDPAERTQFSQPVRQIAQMVLVLLAVGAGSWAAYPAVAPIFAANPWLNGVIIGVFVLGVVACFLQVFQLVGAVAWIEGFAEARPGHDISRPPALLVPLAALLRTRRARGQISASSSRSILESVSARIEEVRDITRYIVNTLIFLGLLGTFWGLATTVPAVVDTIRSLNPGEGDGSMEVFGRLIGGLEDQLAGMGTAFASSLLGLAGSLVVGLLELFAGHGQSRFYRELEDWLSSITRVGLVGDSGEETIDQYSLAAVLDHMNVQMETLQEMFQRAEAGRLAADARVGQLSEALTQMAHRIDSGLASEAGMSDALHRVADGQDRMAEALRGMPSGNRGGLDGEGLMRIRSIDVQLLKILEEMGQGRLETVEELRADMTALTRALRQLNRLVMRSTQGQVEES